MAQYHVWLPDFETMILVRGSEDDAEQVARQELRERLALEQFELTGAEVSAEYCMLQAGSLISRGTVTVPPAGG